MYYATSIQTLVKRNWYRIYRGKNTYEKTITFIVKGSSSTLTNIFKFMFFRSCAEYTENKDFDEWICNASLKMLDLELD